MKLSLGEIEGCLRVLLEMLRARGVDNVETGSEDFYWFVSTDDWFELRDTPDLAVGSLDDDIRELKKLLSDRAGASVVDLERVANVLKLMACDSSGQ